MYDTKEGNILLDKLENIYEDNSGEIKKLFKEICKSRDSETGEISKPINVYLMSFSKDDDGSIHTWIHYGDNAKGCSIQFDESFFDEEDDINHINTSRYKKN